MPYRFPIVFIAGLPTKLTITAVSPPTSTEFTAVGGNSPSAACHFANITPNDESYPWLLLRRTGTFSPNRVNLTVTEPRV